MSVELSQSFSSPTLRYGELANLNESNLAPPGNLVTTQNCMLVFLFPNLNSVDINHEILVELAMRFLPIKKWKLILISPVKIWKIQLADLSVKRF